MPSQVPVVHFLLFQGYIKHTDLLSFVTGVFEKSEICS